MANDNVDCALLSEESNPMSAYLGAAAGLFQPAPVASGKTPSDPLEGLAKKVRNEFEIRL
jgi:hypothetical protein